MVYNNKFVFICLGKAEGWVGGCDDLTELSQMFQCHLAVNSDNWDYSAPYTGVGKSRLTFVIQKNTTIINK